MPQKPPVQLADLSPAAKRGLVNFTTFLANEAHPQRGPIHLAREGDLWICSLKSEGKGPSEYYGVLTGFVLAAGATWKESGAAVRFAVQNEGRWVSDSDSGRRCTFLIAGALASLLPNVVVG